MTDLGFPDWDWCPTCGVPPDEACVSPSGRHVGYDHAARRRLRERMERKAP